MWSANTFKLDRSQILLFGNELSPAPIPEHDACLPNKFDYFLFDRSPQTQQIFL